MKRKIQVSDQFIVSVEFDSMLSSEIHVHRSDCTVHVHQINGFTLAEVATALQDAAFSAGCATLDVVVLPEVLAFILNPSAIYQNIV
jgi:hypothetical protein